ncbi:hypothetical protein AGMMS49525_14910 [Bacteroidia bacterium]|nr:hypothetical protein AGMMS49525_14910 [Bacteroidia bacterium]
MTCFLQGIYWHPTVRIAHTEATVLIVPIVRIALTIQAGRGRNVETDGLNAKSEKGLTLIIQAVKSG